jgi:hypothetical protein
MQYINGILLRIPSSEYSQMFISSSLIFRTAQQAEAFYLTICQTRYPGLIRALVRNGIRNQLANRTGFKDTPTNRIRFEGYTNSPEFKKLCEELSRTKPNYSDDYKSKHSKQRLIIFLLIIVGMMGVLTVLGIVFLVFGRGAAPEPTEPSSSTTEINTALDETEMRRTTLVIPDSSSVTGENVILSVPSDSLHQIVSRKIPFNEVATISTPNPEKELRLTVTQRESTTTEMPFLFVDKESMEYLKVFDPQWGRVFPLRNDLTNLKFFHKSLCDNEPFKTLKISFTTMNSIGLLDERYVHCPHKVTGLDLSGFISFPLLLRLLEIFNNVQYLSISGHEMCAIMDSQMLGMPTNYLKHKSLRFLRFSNLTGDCKGVYKFFNEFVDLQGISTFVFDESFVSITDSVELRILLLNLSMLKNLFFRGNLCSSCVLFSRKGTDLDPWRNLEALVFHVPEGIAFQALKCLKNLLPSLRNLFYLETSVPIPSKGSLLMFKKQKLLRYMNVTINFPDNQTRFSADFFSFFPMLQEAHLKLLFNNTSRCVVEPSNTIQLTNLKKFIGRSELQILTISSNCRITAIKGWYVPCREFESNRDSTTLLHTVSMITCANCTKAGCMR